MDGETQDAVADRVEGLLGAKADHPVPVPGAHGETGSHFALVDEGVLGKVDGAILEECPVHHVPSQSQGVAEHHQIVMVGLRLHGEGADQAHLDERR